MKRFLEKLVCIPVALLVFMVDMVMISLNLVMDLMLNFKNNRRNWDEEYE